MKAMSYVGSIFIAGLLTGCSGGLSEVAMVIPDDKDGHHYIVNRDLVHDRVWANQHQLNGDFHCTKMRSSEEMAELRAVHGSNVVRYTHCTPLDTYAHPYAKNQLPGAGAVWLDSAKAVLYSATAAYVGHEIGKGIGKSGTTVNQQGGGANAENMTNSGNTSVKGNTSINSNNKNIMK